MPPRFDYPVPGTDLLSRLHVCAEVNMAAMLNDVADGKFMLKTHAHALAMGYEAVIERRDQRIAQLEADLCRARASPGAASAGPAAAPRAAPPQKPPPAAARGRADGPTGQPDRGTTRPAGPEEGEQRLPGRQPGQNADTTGNKRGRPAKPGQTEAAKEEARKRQKRGLNLKMFKAIAGMALLLGGGVMEFTVFFIWLLKCSVLPSRLKKKYRWFHPDTVKLILDDPDLYKCFQKEMDKRRRPPIAAFVSARLSGVSISAMDKLRFSTIWTPGHTTLANAVREMERSIQSDWCPSGPVASWGTTRTEQEQRAAPSGSPEVHDDDDDDDADGLEDEVDAAMREERDDAVHEEAALNIERQAMDLLKAEFPADTDAKLMDRWAGGVDATIDNEHSACNVLQVVCVKAGRVLGFMKVLITAKEVWVDEVLVAKEARGLSLSWRLLGRVLDDVRRRLLRLQVRKDNEHAIGLYTAGWLLKLWEERASGNWAGCEPSDKSTHDMYEGTCSKTRSAVQAHLSVKPIDEELEFRLFAAFAIPGVELDRVGLEQPEGTDDPPPVAAEATTETTAEETAEETAAPTAEQREEAELQQEEAMDAQFANDLEDENLGAEPGSVAPGTVAPSHGTTSIVNAIQILFISAHALTAQPERLYAMRFLCRLSPILRRCDCTRRVSDGIPDGQAHPDWT